MLSDEEVARWCELSVGSWIRATALEAGNLSRVVPVTLDDGRNLVIKIRPWQDRFVGCAAVQRHLALAGYPCPEPIAGPDLYSGWAISAESARPGGHQRDPLDGADHYAQLLHWLIAAGPAPDEVPPLLPSPPWTAWDHDDSSTWPARDDRGRNLNDLDGPGWLDRAAARVRDALSSYRSPMRVGHGDWESQNITWDGDAPLAVHDWDSVIAQPEPAIVGLASAVWPAHGGRGEAATVEQSAQFIAVYEQRCGGWSEEERAAAWTAGLWVRLFNAKKDAVDGGGPQLDRLAEELADRLERAGLDVQ